MTRISTRSRLSESLVVALAAALLLLCAAAGHAEAAIKKNYFYRQCPKKSFCLGATVNAAHSRLLSFQLHAACAAGDQSIDVLNVPKDIVISRKTRRFEFKKTVTSFQHTPEGDLVILGEMTIKGTVKPRKYIKGSWTIDSVADDCVNRTSGAFKLTYRFVTYGV